MRCGVHGRIADGVRPLGRSVCTVGFSTDGHGRAGVAAYSASICCRYCVPSWWLLLAGAAWRPGLPAAGRWPRCDQRAALFGWAYPGSV